MKKIVAFIMCVCLSASLLAGCGANYANYAGTGTGSNEQQTTAVSATADEATENNVKAADFKDSFKGLCDYFTKKVYIVEKEGGKTNETKMDASLIGAKEGKRFTTKFGGKSITIELYAYDVKNLNATAQKTIKSVKTDGVFAIESEYQGSTVTLPEVTAYLSDNGKYLMIYTDASINDKKPDTESDNYKHREQVIEDFKAFHK